MGHNERFPVQTSDHTCPGVIDRLKTGVLCCRLDDDLTLLWGNSSFFNKVGYSRDCFFQNLREYYGQFPEDFSSVRQEVRRATTKGISDIELTVRLPRKEGGFFWASLSGSFAEDVALGGPMLQMEFADIDALMAEKEEQAGLHQQKSRYFHWMLDAYRGNAYVSDMDTYELLYLNQAACDVLGARASTVVGRKCYEVIQGRTSPCPFCTNDKLCAEDFFTSGNFPTRS